MQIRLDDTVLLRDHRIGIVERRQGSELIIRIPAEQNKRDRVNRNEVRALAEAIDECRAKGTKFQHGLSLTGNSTLAELVALFGYSTERLRQDSLDRVVGQLLRAGLEVHSKTDRWGRDDEFKLLLLDRTNKPEEEKSEPPKLGPALLESILLPEPFWPTAFGLDPDREISFLRALAGPEPLLCLLYNSDEANTHSWMRPTWEGMVSWAFRAAQRFNPKRGDGENAEVRIGPGAMLHSYLNHSLLRDESPTLLEHSRALNLIVLAKESESPVDFTRLRATWPGQIFEFRPQPMLCVADEHSADVLAILKCILLVAGMPKTELKNPCPLQTFLWCRDISARILARGSLRLGELMSAGEVKKFKGSNESSTALALKGILAGWVQSYFVDPNLQFEECLVKERDEEGDVKKVNRIDLLIQGKGRFEVETLVGSGPMEAFYHQKVFSRHAADTDQFWLVLPGDAILWAGPYLADIAHHLGQRGQVVFPSSGVALMKLEGRALNAEMVPIEFPAERLQGTAYGGKTGEKTLAERRIRLKDVAGYEKIKSTIDERIIWPEKHCAALGRPSRSSGILFFGPPGCGKSHLAQAIAGELEQEVRLLGPADLRGPYISWGQVMIRDQLDWLAANNRRMLIIDEIDAVGRSRRNSGNMHTDEMADVNELLVQLDRVCRLGRIIIGTTNYVDSLDDALVRSGRFGTCIPVPPPDLREATDILIYYLEYLSRNEEGTTQVKVRTPERSEVQSLLEPLFVENVKNGQFFCGADLEVAVNQTYQRCLRRTRGDKWADDNSAGAVDLTVDELANSLREVKRSATDIQEFLEVTGKFCGARVKEDLEKSLFGPGEST